ncbi:MAG: alpha/beta hydrolase domain-containing protein [Chloroflexota bacterium]|nr:alpha/beta hydrolase domain-containing protein [Chloroflexota bacterium]
MAITELEITKRTSFASGESFGDVGPYELLEGTAYYAVSPTHPRNQGITDLDLAPANVSGMVEFTADFAMLQPVNPDRGNRRILFDVVNRGRKTALTLNSVPTATDPTAPLEAGNGYLMRRGYTVVWAGWQADVPPTPGLIGLHAPEAMGPEGPLTGKIMCQFQCDQPSQVFLLADRQHLANPAADPEEAEATLTVRDLPNSPATPVDRGQWSFVRVEDEDLEPQHRHIYMPSGFEPGRIYQLVYTTTGSRIVGLGFAAMRDAVSFLKYAPATSGNPCLAGIEYAYAMGRSQSGRFLRQYIHTGINEDEEDRVALDGIIPHVAGGMRGEFNLRFGQPSKDVCYIIPEMFPFTDTPQSDPVTGAQGSLLDALEQRGNVPRIMFTNTSAEYWRGDAALIHTDLETLTDAPESPSVRRYHFAGCQHGSGDFPPLEIRPADGLKGHLPFNSVDYAPLSRAVLENLDRWVTTGEEPPASRHPSLNDGTAVESHTLLERFARLPGVRVPAETTRAIRLDYGPEAHLGRTTKLPADEGEEFPALVADLDESFNERGGIRLPDLSVPVATYTGWNLRDESIGNPNLFIGITGGLAGWTLPLPVTRDEREKTGDPRRSVEERYASREDYLEQVSRAAMELVGEGYLLEEDVEEVVDLAGRKYDHFVGDGEEG